MCAHTGVEGVLKSSKPLNDICCCCSHVGDKTFDVLVYDHSMASLAFSMVSINSDFHSHNFNSAYILVHPIILLPYGNATNKNSKKKKKETTL